MKKLVLIILLLSAFSFAADKPNAADYTINVHVTASNLEGGAVPLLNVVIDGKNYLLRSQKDTLNSKGVAILTLGDYKAKLVVDEHNSAHEFTQVYEFLFSDGRIMKFNVVGTSE
jgi:hypothetical protein